MSRLVQPQAVLRVLRRPAANPDGSRALRSTTDHDTRRGLKLKRLQDTPWGFSPLSWLNTSHALDLAPLMATPGRFLTLSVNGGREATALTLENFMPAILSRQLVSIADAADALAVSTRPIRRYIAEGQLEAVRLGRKTLRIKVASIERFINAKSVGNRRHCP